MLFDATRICTVFGIPIRITGSLKGFLLALFVIQAYERGVTESALIVLATSTVFLLVTLHELGHAFAAHRCGVKTHRIDLSLFGGIAQLTRIPREPAQELYIALCGPLVNALIWLACDTAAAACTQGGLFEFFSVMATINKMLFCFNFLPIFPMDGGRVLRAVLAFFLKYKTATFVACSLGVVGGICMSGYAVYSYWHPPFYATMTIIGLFIAGAAVIEYRHTDETAIPEEQDEDLPIELKLENISYAAEEFCSKWKLNDLGPKTGHVANIMADHVLNVMVKDLHDSARSHVWEDEKHDGVAKAAALVCNSIMVVFSESQKQMSDELLTSMGGLYLAVADYDRSLLRCVPDVDEAIKKNRRRIQYIRQREDICS